MMRDFDKKLYPNTYNYVKDNIVEGVRCNRCGTTVLISEVEGYTYQWWNVWRMRGFPHLTRSNHYDIITM